jgi:hypothetical protein
VVDVARAEAGIGDADDHVLRPGLGIRPPRELDDLVAARAGEDNSPYVATVSTRIRLTREYRSGRLPAMIVRDAGDFWQIVLQSDHSRLAGSFAAAWGNDRFASPRPAVPVAVAASRHDEVWCTWERHPRVDLETGKPVNFAEVWVPTHLAFYRGGIAVLLEEDRYAALLMAMHAAGIYTGRYGTEPSLTQTSAAAARAEIDAFVSECEERYTSLAAELGVGEREQWTNYKIVQVCDRLSLNFAMKDLERGEPFAIAPAPVDYDGTDVSLLVVPDGPWRIRVEPSPFSGRLRLELPRRMVAKRPWTDMAAFREDFFAAPVEQVPIEVG